MLTVFIRSVVGRKRKSESEVGKFIRPDFEDTCDNSSTETALSGHMLRQFNEGECVI